MSTNQASTEKSSDDWKDVTKKREAYRRFIKYLKQHKEEIAECINNHNHAREIFEREGKIDIPDNVKIVLLPEGDSTTGGKLSGSGVIEVLPDNVDPDSDKALEFFQCTYKIWTK